MEADGECINGGLDLVCADRELRTANMGFSAPVNRKIQSLTSRRALSLTYMGFLNPVKMGLEAFKLALDKVAEVAVFQP